MLNLHSDKHSKCFGVDKKTAILTIALILAIISPIYSQLTGQNLYDNMNLFQNQLENIIANLETINETLMTEWNPTFYGLQKPYSYIISKVDSYYCMQNGTTGKLDYTSTNFTQVWNFAGANSTTLGGTVFVKAGAYSQDSASYMYLYSNVTYQGEGYGTAILLKAGSAWSGAIENIAGTTTNPATVDENITVRGFRFVGKGVSMTAKAFGLELHSAKHCLIEQNWFENMTEATGNWAVMLNGETDDGVTNETITAYNIVRGNHIKSVSYDGIHIKDGVTPYGNGSMYNIIENNIVEDTQVAIAAYLADYNTIRNNIIINATRLTTGGTPVGICNHGSLGTKILDNVINGSQVGISQPTVASRQSEWGDIRGNTVIQDIVNNIGIALDTGAGGGDNIIGNTFLFPNVTYDQWGIKIDSNNNLVQSNLFNGSCGTNGAIYVDGDFNTITGNKYLLHTNLEAINLASGSNNNTIVNDVFLTGSGIHLNSGSTLNLVEHNNFHDDITGSEVWDQGTSNLMRWNYNWKTEYSASAVNVTATTFTFTPAMDAVPIRAYASFNNSGVTGYSWSYSAPTLTITFASGTLNENVTCYVEAFSWNYP